MQRQIAKQIASKPYRVYPLLAANERLLIWEQARGMWKNRKPEPIKELEKMRKEWKRHVHA